MVRWLALSLLALVLMAQTVRADSLYGAVRFKDGSKDRGTTAITTSWNGERGKLDGNGEYRLDFKGKVGKKVTVYVNKKTYTKIEVKGDTRLDIVVP